MFGVSSEPFVRIAVPNGAGRQSLKKWHTGIDQGRRSAVQMERERPTSLTTHAVEPLNLVGGQRSLHKELAAIGQFHVKDL